MIYPIGFVQQINGNPILAEGIFHLAPESVNFREVEVPQPA